MLAMSKRRLIRWSLILAILAAFAVWLEPTRVVWGWLRGEAFYQARPTSYWRLEFDRWHMTVGYGRDPTGKEHRQEHWIRDQGWLAAWLNDDEGRECPWPNPTVERIDAEALPVLQELVGDSPHSRVQNLANYWIKRIEDGNPNGLP